MGRTKKTRARGKRPAKASARLAFTPPVVPPLDPEARRAFEEAKFWTAANRLAGILESCGSRVKEKERFGETIRRLLRIAADPRRAVEVAKRFRLAVSPRLLRAYPLPDRFEALFLEQDTSAAPLAETWLRDETGRRLCPVTAATYVPPQWAAVEFDPSDRRAAVRTFQATIKAHRDAIRDWWDRHVPQHEARGFPVRDLLPPRPPGRGRPKGYRAPRIEYDIDLYPQELARALWQSAPSRSLSPRGLGAWVGDLLADPKGTERTLRAWVKQHQALDERDETFQGLVQIYQQLRMYKAAPQRLKHLLNRYRT